MLRERPAYRALESHYRDVRDLHLRDLFASDPDRGTRLTVEAAGLYLDYSKHRVTDDTVALLVALAEEVGLRERIEAMFSGERINVTENRSVLHTALRLPREAKLVVDGHDIVPDVHEVLGRMASFADRIRTGAWTGHTGRRIRNVVNIGIGGSDLGPVMAYEALRAYAERDLTFRFVSNVDGTDFAEATRDLSREETLFVVSSKTFTTLETMTNARTARAWLLGGLDGDESAVARHFVAVSTNAEAVTSFGIDTDNMFGFWDWVGGRYSMDSAIGLATMIAIGPDAFRELLAGFHAVDEHFRTTPFERNLPALMGLLAVWYRGFFGAETVAVLPYDQYLKRFPAYLQQLTMESNGKRVTLDGAEVDYDTGAIYGRAGHERPALVLPADPPGDGRDPVRLHRLLRLAEPARRPPRHPHRQPDRPDRGARVRQDGGGSGRGGHARRARAAPRVPGNRPTSTILAEQLTPRVLGSLVALYEHSVFTQGVIWNVDSFDQWGVELGKVLATRILPELSSDSELAHDSSTNALIERYRSRRRA